jgi:hypothetical protein
MNPIKDHPKYNFMLSVAEDLSEIVLPLPVEKTEWGYISYWAPNAEELRLIAEGKPIRLMLVGHTHPPISVDVER